MISDCPVEPHSADLRHMISDMLISLSTSSLSVSLAAPYECLLCERVKWYRFEYMRFCVCQL